MALDDEQFDGFFDIEGMPPVNDAFYSVINALKVTVSRLGGRLTIPEKEWLNGEGFTLIAKPSNDGAEMELILINKCTTSNTRN